jgi:uncharacterized membrane protein
MTDCDVPTKKGSDPLTVVILLGLVILAVFSIVLSLINAEFGRVFLPGDAVYVPGGVAYEAIFIMLTIATDALYVLGGGVIAFGATLLAVRFVQCKLEDPYKASCVSRHLSGYLTLSLEFFIGAEIIKTVVVRTYEEFLVLILVILSRGLFSLILYLERRWHGGAETE